MELYAIQAQATYQLTATEGANTTNTELGRSPSTDTDRSLIDTFQKSDPPKVTYDRTGTVYKSGEQEETESETSAEMGKGPDGKPLSEDDEARLQELKKTDLKVRAHEQAHMAAGADLVKGGASFTYENGPDGARYAVGGEVSIDTSTGGTPRETIARMQRVRAAALAPADPSPQDRSVAAAATAKAATAAAELAAESRGNMQISGDEKASQPADKAGIEAYHKSKNIAPSSNASIDCMA